MHWELALPQNARAQTTQPKTRSGFSMHPVRIVYPSRVGTLSKIFFLFFCYWKNNRAPALATLGKPTSSNLYHFIPGMKEARWPDEQSRQRDQCLNAVSFQQCALEKSITRLTSTSNCPKPSLPETATLQLQTSHRSTRNPELQRVWDQAKTVAPCSELWPAICFSR